MFYSSLFANEQVSVLKPVTSQSIVSDLILGNYSIILSTVFAITFLLILLVWMYWAKVNQNRISNEKSNHYKSLLESTAAIPWELELSTWQFTYVGPQIEKVSGFKPEEWYAENFWVNQLHLEDKKSSVLFCSDATALHKDHEFEYRFIKKDGSIVWFRDTVQVVLENNIPVILRGFMFDITTQKEEQQLQTQTERRLADAQNIAHIGTWDFYLTLGELKWSDETYRIFEVDAKQTQISYEQYINIVHPDDRENLESTYNNSVKNKNRYEIEHRLLMPDGRIKYVNGIGEHHFNSDGELIRSFGSVQDITDRKRTDLAIQTIASSVSSTSGDDFYQQLVTNMAHVFEADYAFIGLLDDNDKMLVNTLMVYAHGKIVPNMSYSLIDTPCINVVGKIPCLYPDHVQQLFPNDELLIEMGVESYIGIPLYNAEGNPAGLVVVLDSKPMENTNQLEEVLKIFASRTEAELERTASNKTIQKLSLAVEQSPNLIIITDAEGIIEYVNAAFIETTGYSRDEVLNKSPSIIKSGLMPEDFYKDLWETLKEGKTWSGVFHNKRSNGDLYWDEAKISPIKNKQGEITHYLGVQSDITDKKEMEQQLRRSQKMDALGKLTGGIAHDYNNMLGVIFGYTELLEMVLAEDEKSIGYVKEIQRATDRGATLTKKLLTFSRLNSTEPENVNINQILLDVQNMIEKTLTARIKLEYQLGNSIWPIYLDKGDLEDAILNMCINSMHAMPDGGDLIISTFNRTLDASEANVLSLSAGEYVHLSISDSGCGISEAELPQIFDPFFTSKGDLGTGLGLTQVYGFIKRAKGAITIDSNLNVGTYISIYLPHIFVANQLNDVISDEPIHLDGTETILVVDDEIAIAELSNKTLSSKGYKVHVANSGLAALDILKNNKIDLMVSDVIMPNMDGYKLSAKVREIYPSVKIQLVSGFDDHKKRTEEDHLLYENLLHKPYSSNQLLKIVRKLLDE